MDYDKKTSGCASSSSGEQHVEKQSMHSSFKGPPAQGTNQAMCEGQDASGAAGYSYQEESNSNADWRDEGNRRGAEENLDVSVHRGYEELNNHTPASSSGNDGEDLLLNQTAVRGDSNGRASSSQLHPPSRVSTSSDDDFERLNTPIDSEMSELQRRLRESERKRQELEEALRLAQSQNPTDRDESQRRPNGERAAEASTQDKMTEMDYRLRLQELKLDAKRREITRLRSHVLIYEKDFISMNERARAAERMVDDIDSDLARQRLHKYSRNCGLNPPCGLEAHFGEHSARHSDGGSYSEPRGAYNEQRNRSTIPLDNFLSSEADNSQYGILAPRPGYGLEVDSPFGASAYNRGETTDSDDEETVVLEIHGGHSRGGGSLDESSRGGISQHDERMMSRSENGRDVTHPTDDEKQLNEETEQRHGKLEP